MGISPDPCQRFLMFVFFILAILIDVKWYFIFWFVFIEWVMLNIFSFACWPLIYVCSDNLCLLIGVFSAFTFSVINDVVRFKSVILILVFICSICLLLSCILFWLLIFMILFYLLCCVTSYIFCCVVLLIALGLKYNKSFPQYSLPSSDVIILCHL